MLRNVLRSFTLSVAAVSTVAAMPQYAAADTAPAGPAVCGPYIDPIAYPSKDYATTGPLATTYQALLAKVLSTKSYSMTIVAHEEKEGKTQDRTYHFTYLCPSLASDSAPHPAEARISIISGSGYLADPGGEAVWHDDPTDNRNQKVRGHQGGAASHLKIIANIDDPRATSMLGRTVNTSVFADMLDHAKTFGPTTQGADQSITIKTESGASETHQCHVYTSTIDAAAQKLNVGEDKEVIYLDTTTQYPVRHEGYIGGKMVEWEEFSNIQTSPPATALTPADFQ